MIWWWHGRSKTTVRSILFKLHRTYFGNNGEIRALSDFLILVGQHMQCPPQNVWGTTETTIWREFAILSSICSTNSCRAWHCVVFVWYDWLWDTRFPLTASFVHPRKLRILRDIVFCHYSGTMFCEGWRKLIAILFRFNWACRDQISNNYKRHY